MYSVDSEEVRSGQVRHLLYQFLCLPALITGKEFESSVLIKTIFSSTM